MKKLLFLICLSISLFSCKEEYKYFDVVFDKAVLYYYGRSPIGTTFEVPVKFYNNGKEIASFIFYSYNAELENCVYVYNEKTYAGINWTNKSYYVNKTFYKGLCTWDGNIITDGYVAVKKGNGKYEFVVDVTDNTGEKHKGKFEGKATRENIYPQSEIGGTFADATITDSGWQGQHNFLIGLDGGDTFYSIQVAYYMQCAEMPDEVVGVYEINNLAPHRWTEDIGGFSSNTYRLVSGQIKVSRVNKPHKYKIEVDVTDINGYRLQGCFDGGNYFSTFYP